MKSHVDVHATYRALLSASMDGPLPADETIHLEAHLASCPRCRAVAREYRSQRQGLAALRPLPPPRDLWARTAAALDLEIARSPDSARAARDDRRRHTRRQSSPLLALTAMGSLALAAVVVVTEAGNEAIIPPRPAGTVAVQPTPFQVARQDLVVADFTPQGVAVYQTQVSEVCPPSMIDCTTPEMTSQPVLQIHADQASRGFVVHSDTGRLALVAGNDQGYQTISVVMLPPYVTNGTGASGAGAPGTATANEATPTSPGVASLGSGSPGGSPAVTISTAPTTNPGASVDATASLLPSGTSRSAPPQTPRPTSKPTKQPTHASPRPASSPAGSPTSSGPVLPGQDGGSPTTSPAGDAAPSAVPGAPVAIVAGVRVVGATPDWSADGNMLAFSAMPADQSQAQMSTSGRPGSHAPDASRTITVPTSHRGIGRASSSAASRRSTTANRLPAPSSWIRPPACSGVPTG